MANTKLGAPLQWFVTTGNLLSNKLLVFKAILNVQMSRLLVSRAIELGCGSR